jgi:16S rRNA (guanine(527)-N(7))-methyltransferase GidB
MDDTISKYFPSLSALRKNKLSQLNPVYERWNRMINVISRKDMDNFTIHHVLHSLAIAKVISFVPGTRILDIGTGGGFPGVPLAILFPETEFFLLDSIGKKIKVVTEVAHELELTNIVPLRKRAEDEDGKYDFVISRAVTQFPQFVKLAVKNISKTQKNSLSNGILYLKGGTLDEEIEPFIGRVKVWEIKEFFSEPFFDTKKIVYLPV